MNRAHATYDVRFEVARDQRPVPVEVHCEASGYAIALGNARRVDTGEPIRLTDLERQAAHTLARARNEHEE